MLKTNLPERTHPLAEVLRTYKGQSQVERRFHHLKGPLAVAPMFLKNPDRIAGLLCVLVWALMVLALMERQVRRELKGRAAVRPVPGGPAEPGADRPVVDPGAERPVIVIVHQGGTVARRLAQPDPTQRRDHPVTWDQL